MGHGRAPLHRLQQEPRLVSKYLLKNIGREQRQGRDAKKYEQHPAHILLLSCDAPPMQPSR